jgi:hypothetical protein
MTYPGAAPSSSLLSGESEGITFWVGSVGWLRPLPNIYSDVAVADARLGGSSTSLTGRQWRDTLGYQRTWSWGWANLLPAHMPYVHALSHGLVPDPLRLIDPHEVNRLPEQVASGGSRARSTDGFAITAGGLSYRDLKSLPSDRTTLPPAPLLRGAQEWQRPSGGPGTMYLTGDASDGSWQLPAVPAEGPLELSCWVVGVAGLPVELAWTEYAADGTASPYYADGTGPEQAVLSSSVWQRLVLEVDPGTHGAVSLTPRLTVSDEAAVAGSVFTTAWQIRSLTSGGVTNMGSWQGDCAPEDLSGGWWPGGGAPYVVTDPGTTTYRLYGLRDSALLLTETTP